MSGRYSATIIAKWLIAWAEEETEGLSNMKLQKLLYYAQGHYLARFQEPLFTEQIQAWSHGPVVPRVYHQFKEFGRSPIQLPGSDSFTWDAVDPDTAEFLSMVWNTYGGYTATHLRNMTHNERPWIENWQGDDERDVVIPNDSIAEHFRYVEAVRGQQAW